MSASQIDLFETASHTSHAQTEEVAATMRAQLHETLELVRSANEMPWTNQLAVIRAENAFRYGKEALPPTEAARLWDAFNAEMARLYAVADAAD